MGARFHRRWLDFRVLGFVWVLLILQQQLLSADPQAEGGKKNNKLPTCQPNDFHYTYTECSDAGVRWRVQVPDPDHCQGGAPEPPFRAVDCGFSCGQGEYLDKDETQQCKKCPTGTYSLGGGKRFEDWNTLPEGFATVSDEKEDWYMDTNCANESFWLPKGSYIKSPGSLCSSKLLFSANLKKPGSVSFTYSIATSETMLHVQVHNDQCEALSGSQDRWPGSTGEGQWKTERMELKSGLNIISWKSIGISLSSNKAPPPILIKTVEIMGLSYTSQCTKCRPGTFAKDEASIECAQCPANTFSAEGASKCTDCDTNIKYSNPGASECINREPCTDNDYYMTHTPCDSKNQTQTTYKWIEPRICRVDIKGASQLPKNGQVESCPPCNPGMSIFNHTTCDFCPENQFSDGTSVCQPCPASTAPVYGMDFKWWNQMPPNMDSSCLSFSGYGCTENVGWLLAGDSVHSSLGQADDAYLLLQLTVEGFDSEEGFEDGKAAEIGELSFVFSLDCTGDCGLFLLEERGPGSPKSPVIETWEHTQEKQEYRYSITKNGPRTFTWAFQKTDISEDFSDEVSSNYRNDIAKIFSIKVTNAINGGAAICKKCPRGSNLKGCIPCEPGMYIANNTENTCTKCPDNTYLRANNAYGKEACLPCGPNLYSNKDKTQCYSTCHVHANKKHYQLTKLQGYHTLHTGASFTAKGSRYFHSFNFTLCGDEKDAVTCVNNVTYYSEGNTEEFEDESDSSPPVKSLVCQATLIPSPAGPSETISAQPMSLGDTLLGITTDKSLGHLNATVFKPESEDTPDLHFYLHSGSVTKACPRGRSTIVYLRCDPTAKGNGTFKLPEMCPAGTCDGCTFHILWKTEYGCPVCMATDYTEIREQCNKNGKQKIRYVWKEPKMCMYGEELPEDTVGQCPVIPWWAQIPMYAQIAIAVFVGCVGLMCAMIVYFWKRNRKLEYKYSKLVAGASGELPAAETCAITEGEEEDDVIFEDGKNNGRSLFSKFKSKPNDMDMDKTGLLLSDDEEFRETIELSPSHIQPLSNI